VWGIPLFFRKKRDLRAFFNFRTACIFRFGGWNSIIWDVNQL